MADVAVIPNHLLSTCYGWRVKSKSMAADVGRTLILQPKSEIEFMSTAHEAKEKMIAQCVDLMRFRHFSINTEKTYCAHIRSYKEADGSVRGPFNDVRRVA